MFGRKPALSTLDFSRTANLDLCIHPNVVLVLVCFPLNAAQMLVDGADTRPAYTFEEKVLGLTVTLKACTCGIKLQVGGCQLSVCVQMRKQEARPWKVIFVDAMDSGVENVGRHVLVQQECEAYVPFAPCVSMCTTSKHCPFLSSGLIPAF